MNKALNVIIACGGTGGHLFPGIAVAQQLRSMGHNPVLLISQKEVDAEASRKYGDLKFHTVQAIAKPATLSPKMPGFLWKMLRSWLTCRSIIRKEQADVVIGMGGKRQNIRRFARRQPILHAFRRRAICIRADLHDGMILFLRKYKSKRSYLFRQSDIVMEETLRAAF